MPLLFRDDDISPSSNFGNVSKSYNVIKELFRDANIISCITLFSRYNQNGSVYAEIPFKDRETNWFYNVDKFLLEYEYIIKDNIASHGLFHVNHAKISKDAQSMSILGSCRFLKTNKFCAPFNAFNDDTLAICAENNINPINRGMEWRSLEHNNFDPSYPYWYFHSWRFTPEQLRKKLSNNAKQLGC